MTVHETHARKSSEADRFGVSWGEELADDKEPQQKQKSVKYYTSFYLNGTKYRQDDTVYLHSSDGLPYIGRIGKLYESVKDKKKQMVVRWFCRPSELPEGLPNVDYSESCKEVFMMWGDGAKNVNNPACTIRHCSVVRTAGEGYWNRKDPPSVEQIAAADHVFNRVYDLKSRTLRTLGCIVKQYGERYVTGVGEPSSKKGDDTSCKTFVGVRNSLDGRPPLAMLASSDSPSLKLDCNVPELTSLPALVPSPNSPSITLIAAEGQMESSVRKSSPSVIKAAGDKVARSAHQKFVEDKKIAKAPAHHGKKRTHVNSVGNADPADSQKRQKIGSSSALLLPQAQEKVACRKLASPRLGEGKKRSPHELTTAQASWPRQHHERLAGSKLPSTPLGEGRKKASNDSTTSDASRPQQDHGRLAGGALASPGAGEGRRKSSNDLTNSDAFRSQQAHERLSAVKLPSPGGGEGRKKSSKGPTNADAVLCQQAPYRLAGGKFSSPGAGERREKLSNDHTTADQQDAAALSRERQKCTLKVSSTQNSLKAKKRPASDLKGELLKRKSSAPSHVVAHVVDAALKKEVPNVSPSVASDPKIGELRSPRVPQRSLSENDRGKQQAQGPATLSPTNQEEDGRVSSTHSGEILNQVKTSRKVGANTVGKNDIRSLSPEVASKRSTLLDDKCCPDPMSENINCARKQSSKEAEDDGIAAASRTHTADAKGAVHLDNSRGLEKVAKHSSPEQINDANMKSIEEDQDKKPFKERSSDGQERRGVSSMQDDVEGKSAMLIKSRKSSTSNHGKVPVDEVVQPTSKESKFVTKGNQDVKIESQLKASSAWNSLPARKRARPSLGDSRHGEIGPVHKPLKKTQGSGLEASPKKRKVMRKRDLQLTENRSEQSGEGLKAKTKGLLAKSDPSMFSTKNSDDTRIGEKRPPQGLVNKFGKTLARKPEPRSVANMGGNATALQTTFPLSAAHQGDKIEPKKKIFKIPWEESLRIALEQRKALLLQNLDPWFSSFEIEVMLEDLLQIGCDVRMLPPRSFTCCTSGRALVLFRSQKSAEEALRKLTENWLIWSKDERPVLASMADTETAVSGRIYGFYTAEMFGSRGGLRGTGEEQNSAVATSHCSQPNTVEYEMGIQWRMVQDRHTEAWTIATKAQDETDRQGHEREKKIQ